MKVIIGLVAWYVLLELLVRQAEAKDKKEKELAEKERERIRRKRRAEYERYGV